MLTRTPIPDRRAGTHRRVLCSLQWLASCLGAVLVAAYVTITAAGEIGRSADLARFERARVESFEALASGDSPDMSLWSAQRIRDFSVARREVIAQPLAILRIQSLRLTVPVYPTATELHLNRGAGVIEGMAAPDGGGNLGIAGHRDGFFRVLKDIAIDDVIEVQTRSRTHRYRVTSIDVVQQSDRRLLGDTDDPTITLVTCHPFYYVGDAPRRFIVRGVYVWPASAATSHI
ncbi:MAG TPA: class D sortase [Steroidobacteraceae bacterium]|nr:class D sortase [Steroidobacteraceae bacterium]